MLVLASFVALALHAGNLGAQVAAPTSGTSGTFTLTGKVEAQATGSPLPYSTVSIDQIGRERFTDATGTFKYFLVTPGKYRIRIRQLGYMPVDSTMAVSATSPDIIFSLVRVPSTLANVEVTAPVRRCEVPEENGYVADPDLLTVLEEAKKNAQRERLLRRTYPFEYKLAQSHDTYDLSDQSHRMIYDTMTFRSDDDWKYRRGKVVSDDRSRLFGEVRVMRLPTLTDFADQRFLMAHCFKYAGITDEDGPPAHRIDFSPDPDIKTPDVEGSIYIDSATYIIRRAEFRLTKGGTVKPAILGMKVTTTYRQILPNVALFDEIESVQPLPKTVTGNHPAEFRQKQQLLSFRFLYGGPPGSGPALVWKNARAEKAPAPAPSGSDGQSPAPRAPAPSEQAPVQTSPATKAGTLPNKPSATTKKSGKQE